MTCAAGLKEIWCRVVFDEAIGAEAPRSRQDAVRYTLQKTIKCFALAAVLTIAAGCENPHLQQVKNEFGWTETRMLSDGWLKSRVVAQPPLYCYHTLADADCFAKPNPEHKHRLIAPPYEGVF